MGRILHGLDLLFLWPSLQAMGYHVGTERYSGSRLGRKDVNMFIPRIVVSL